MKHALTRAAVGIALLAGCEGGNEFKPPPPPAVTVAPPLQEDVTTFEEFTGRLDARDTVEIRARVKGFLETIDFEAGLPVEQGALLFTIEKELFEATLAAAQAELDSRKAALQLAEITLQKAQSAFEKGAVTDLEIAEKEAQRDSAKAAVDGAQAAVESAAIDLTYTSIHAPIAGRMSRELVDIGNLVGAGDSTLLSTLVLDDPIYAYFNVSERFLLEYLKTGPRNRPRPERLKVLLRFADGSDYDEPGFVDFTDNTVDPMTGTLLVRAEFPNPEGNLFPGLFARIRLPNESSQQLLVPEIALQRDLAGSYVLTVDQAGVVTRCDVQLGALVGNTRIILGGLEPTDRVIINGLQRARPGITVTARDSETDAGTMEQPQPTLEETTG